MANILSKDKQSAVISALAEGSSIRSIERSTRVHRDTSINIQYSGAGLTYPNAKAHDSLELGDTRNGSRNLAGFLECRQLIEAAA